MSREPCGRVSENVRGDGSQKSDAGDLRDTSDEKVGRAVMTLEMGVGQLAESRARTIRMLGFVGLHALAPGGDLRTRWRCRALFALWNRHDDLDVGTGRRFDARVLRVAGVREELVL